MRASLQHPGLRTFFWLWLAQTVSGLGSSLTAFALGVWLYQETGQATPLALTALANFLPSFFIGPFAGAVVDQIDRKWAMIVADTGQAFTTFALLALIGLEGPVWVIYPLLAASSAFRAFQFPAQAASLSLLVPKAHLGRANGLRTVSEGVGGLGGPLLAGALVPVIGVSRVMLLDVATFLFAVSVTLALTIPRPPESDEGRRERGKPLWRRALGGVSYIRDRPGLLGLLLVFAGSSFIASLVGPLITPLILARSGGDTVALGLVYSTFGGGWFVGGLLMTAWGGPRPRVHGVFSGLLLSGLLGFSLLGFGRSLPVWMVAGFLPGFLTPVVGGSSLAIWQSKVEPDLQGRVLAVRPLISSALTPFALLLSGVLADNVFEPAMQGELGQTLEPLLGTGDGRGYALMFILAGLFQALCGLSGYLMPHSRKVESELPDALAAD